MFEQPRHRHHPPDPELGRRRLSRHYQGQHRHHQLRLQRRRQPPDPPGPDRHDALPAGHGATARCDHRAGLRHSLLHPQRHPHRHAHPRGRPVPVHRPARHRRTVTIPGSLGDDEIPGRSPRAQAFDERAETQGARTSCLLNSFPTGTRVLLANHKTKPIEKIKIGDKVLATNPQTGKTLTKKVTATLDGTNYDHLIQITVDTNANHADHTSAIIATEHHLFWDADHHTWTRADHLTTGTRLRTPEGTTVRVLRTADASGHPTVHDLTIADLHTYYVQAGGRPVLVHNSGPCDPVSIFNAPGKGMTDKLLNEGFDPADFPGSGKGFPDGNAYFGMHNEGKQIALDYAGRGGYDSNVIEVRIPRDDFNKHFAQYVTSYDGRAEAQIAIPSTVFDVLNRYPRALVGGP